LKKFTYFIATRWSHGVITKYFHALSKALVEQGHKVIIIFDRQRYDVENHNANPAIYIWPSKTPTHLRDALFFNKLVRKYRPDALIANFSSVNILLVVGWLLGVPVRIAWYRTLVYVNIIYDTKNKWKTSFQNRRAQLVYKLATHLVANSFAAKEDIIKEYAVPTQRISIIHNSMMDPFPSIQNSNRDRNDFVCVGQFIPRKGQDILVRAISILKKNYPYIKVEIIGKIIQLDSYQQYVKGLVQELGVEDNFIFTGDMPQIKVLEHMSRAWITLFPTRSEAFGNVCMESMAVGTPIIASRVGGIPELIRDGVDGVLVPPDDPERLAEAIRMLLIDDHLHEMMSLSSRQRFLELFELSTVIKEQANWFIKIVSEVRK
jgi:glycosyltransferase involved in cell wall biosynthesis